MLGMLKKVANAVGLDVDVHRYSSGRETRYYVFPLGESRWGSDRLRGEVYVSDNRPGLCGAYINGGGDDHDVTATLAFPYVGYLAVSLVGVPKPLMAKLGFTGKWDDKREISLRVFDHGVWWTTWMNPDMSKSTDPKWRRGSWHPLDTIFGRQSLSREDKDEPVTVTIPMPEGQYTATTQMSTRYYTRPRWPFEAGPDVMFIKQRSHDTEIPGGIPEPGKGEDAWNCGDDALYAQSGPAESVEHAIGNVVASVLRTRMKRQGHHGWNRLDQAKSA
jgi:hypothetical protein